MLRFQLGERSRGSRNGLARIESGSWVALCDRLRPPARLHEKQRKERLYSLLPMVSWRPTFDSIIDSITNTGNNKATRQAIGFARPGHVANHQPLYPAEDLLLRRLRNRQITA